MSIVSGVAASLGVTAAPGPDRGAAGTLHGPVGPAAPTRSNEGASRMVETVAQPAPDGGAALRSAAAALRRSSLDAELAARAARRQSDLRTVEDIRTDRFLETVAEVRRQAAMDRVTDPVFLEPLPGRSRPVDPKQPFLNDGLPGPVTPGGGAAPARFARGDGVPAEVRPVVADRAEAARLQPEAIADRIADRGPAGSR